MKLCNEALMAQEEEDTPDFSGNTEYGNINSEINYDEVSVAIEKSKLKKAYLAIPNEALKNTNAKLLLTKFFNLCFISGSNPTDWDACLFLVIPIPKKDKDQRDPLQNRCITIVCCVGKVYFIY